jgi:hypothetical protein
VSDFPWRAAEAPQFDERLGVTRPTIWGRVSLTVLGTVSSLGRHYKRSEVSLWGRSEEGHDVLHPGRANLRSELVEYFGVITQDDENQMIGCHLNDVEAMDSLRDPRLRHQLPLCASQEVRTGCLSEMKVIDDSCGHVSDATARRDRLARAPRDVCPEPANEGTSLLVLPAADGGIIECANRP